jgi:hypothetical protein
MARLDWKRGRFSLDYEQNEVDASLRGRQDETGDTVNWYRFDREDSEVSDIYDEGYGEGLVFRGPFPVPMMHVVREEGSDQNTPEGQYWNDTIHATASFRMLERAGFTFLDLEHQNYLRDRFVYDDRVFRVTRMEVLGQIQRRDVVVSLDATELKGDELVNDKQFARWSD